MGITFFKNTNLLDEKNHKLRFAKQKVLKKTFARQQVSKMTNLYDPPGLPYTSAHNKNRNFGV